MCQGPDASQHGHGGATKRPSASPSSLIGSTQKHSSQVVPSFYNSMRIFFSLPSFLSPDFLFSFLLLLLPACPSLSPSLLFPCSPAPFPSSLLQKKRMTARRKVSVCSAAFSCRQSPWRRVSGSQGEGSQCTKQANTACHTSTPRERWSVSWVLHL